MIPKINLLTTILFIYIQKTYVNLCTYNIIYKQKCDRE